MTKKQIKAKLKEILHKDVYDLSSDDIQFLYQHITYELIMEYQEETGEAVLMEFVTEDPKKPEDTPISVSILDLINLDKDLEK